MWMIGWELVEVFDFPILKFEERKSATGVAFCHKGSVFGNWGGGYTQAVIEIIIDC